MKGRSDQTARDYEARILRVLVAIQERLSEAPRLEELAKLACFSPCHFHRVFRGLVGETVGQHVGRLRLERAAMLLQSSKRQILEVALDSGYESHEAFSRAFRKAFGCTPRDYRKDAQQMRQLDAASGVHFQETGSLGTFQALRGGEDAMKIEVKKLERTRVAFVRHVGPYHEVGETWERLCDWAGKECLFGDEHRYFGASYDDPEITDSARLRYDACVTVAGEVQADGEIGVREIPAGRYAVALHVGPYENFSGTYAAIYRDYFAESGKEPGAPPCLEFYLNDPNGTEPEDLLTEVWVPIEEER